MGYMSSVAVEYPMTDCEPRLIELDVMTRVSPVENSFQYFGSENELLHLELRSSSDLNANMVRVKTMNNDIVGYFDCNKVHGLRTSIVNHMTLEARYDSAQVIGTQSSALINIHYETVV